MNHLNQDILLTDQLERQLVQQEIGRYAAFRPVLDIKRIAGKIASIFQSGPAEVALDEPRTAH